MKINKDIVAKLDLKDGLKKDECELCGISTWQGKKLPLELHHKNNNHFDNSLSNLIIFIIPFASLKTMP